MKIKLLLTTRVDKVSLKTNDKNIKYLFAHLQFKFYKKNL